MAGVCVSAHSAYFRVETAQALNKGTGQQSPESESVTHPEADCNPEVLGTTQAGPMLGLSGLGLVCPAAFVFGSMVKSTLGPNAWKDPQGCFQPCWLLSLV